MAPDLEVPFVYFATGGLYSRLVLHSLLGAAVLGTLISVLLTVFAYPLVVSFVFRLNKEEIKKKCSFSSVLVLCCLVGTISHVLIDSLHHSFNPLLYPFSSESFDVFVVKNDFASPAIFVSPLMLVLLIFVFVWEIRKGKEGFWKRIFVG